MSHTCNCDRNVTPKHLGPGDGRWECCRWVKVEISEMLGVVWSEHEYSNDKELFCFSIDSENIGHISESYFFFMNARLGCYIETF